MELRAAKNLSRSNRLYTGTTKILYNSFVISHFHVFFPEKFTTVSKAKNEHFTAYCENEW